MILGDGNDTAVWDPGDASDVVEGQTGSDTLRFNGAAAGEVFTASPNGSRLSFNRNLGGVVIDTDEVETLIVNALGGSDSLTLNNLALSDVRAVIADLGVSGFGDGAADAVAVSSTSSADAFSISGSAGFVSIVHALGVVSLFGAEPVFDTLTINGSNAADVVGAGSLLASSIGLIVNGGSGADVIVGSAGPDTLNGEDDDDFIFAGDGNDTVDGGAGTEYVDCGPGIDVVLNAETAVNCP